jgi:hypothetical protein
MLQGIDSLPLSVQIVAYGNALRICTGKNINFVKYKEFGSYYWYSKSIADEIVYPLNKEVKEWTCEQPKSSIWLWACGTIDDGRFFLITTKNTVFMNKKTFQ